MCQKLRRQNVFTNEKRKATENICEEDQRKYSIL